MFVFYCPMFVLEEVIYYFHMYVCRALFRGTRVCVCLCVGMVTCGVVCNGVCVLVIVLKGDVCVMSCCGWGVSGMRY